MYYDKFEASRLSFLFISAEWAAWLGCTRLLIIVTYFWILKDTIDYGFVKSREMTEKQF